MTQNRQESLSLEGAGEQLLALRTQKGLSVHDISLQLRFGERQIAALEAGDYDALPDITVVRAIVRSYARLLGTDVAPILKALESERPDSIVKPLKTHNVTLPSQEITFSTNVRHLNRRWVLAAALLLTATVIAAAWWFAEVKPQSEAAAPAAEALAPSASPEAAPASIPAPPPNIPEPLAQPASKPGMSY